MESDCDSSSKPAAIEDCHEAPDTEHLTAVSFQVDCAKRQSREYNNNITLDLLDLTLLK